MKLAKRSHPVAHYAKVERNSRNYEEKGDWNTSVWEGLQSYFKGSGTPKNHSESHYLQMEKTWHSSEPSQKWLTFQNAFKSTAKTHPGSHKKAKDNIQGTAGLSRINKGHWSWLHYQKDTGQKCHPWKSGKEKTTADPEEH